MTLAVKKNRSWSPRIQDTYLKLFEISLCSTDFKVINTENVN